VHKPHHHDKAADHGGVFYEHLTEILEIFHVVKTVLALAVWTLVSKFSVFSYTGWRNTTQDVIQSLIDWSLGVVSAGRYDGSRLRSDRRDLALLVWFLRRKSSRQEDRHNVQTFFRAAVLAGGINRLLTLLTVILYRGGWRRFCLRCGLQRGGGDSVQGILSGELLSVFRLICVFIVWHMLFAWD